MEATATPHSLLVSIKRNLLPIEEASHDYLRIKKTRKPIVLVKSSIIKRRKNVIKRSRVVRLKPTDKIQRRVQKLKKLIPSNESTAGLEGLFRDTAHYILSLQTRVRFMQIMVNALTTPDSNNY